MGRIEFGPFVFDQADATLRREGKPVALGGRAAALLEALVKADGAIVGKAELLEAGWPGLVVEEANVGVQVAALRKLLGKRADGTEWIATVPRVGYRLAREIVSPTGLEPQRPSLPWVAVLPFDSLSGDPEQEFFADGVVEDIITALSRFRNIAVVSRNSSFVFKHRRVDVREAARQLGAGYVLEGSVRRDSKRVRIVAQLVDGTTGAHLWAHNFDGSSEEIFDVQDRITQTVAAIAAPRIESAESERARRERPGSTAVHDLYLRALPRIDATSHPDSNREGLELLDRALAIDPDYAPVLALAAHAREHLLSMAWPAYRSDDGELAIAYARKALIGAGDDAMILSRCAMVLLQVAHDYTGAVNTCEHAVAINPNNAFVLECAGIAHLVAGELDRAEKLFNRAIEISLSETAHSAMGGLGHIEFLRGNYERARELAMRAVIAAPNFNPIHWLLIASCGHLGRIEEARKALATLEAMVPGVSIASITRGNETRDPRHSELFVEGFRLAGMRES